MVEKSYEYLNLSMLFTETSKQKSIHLQSKKFMSIYFRIFRFLSCFEETFVLE